jgi:hypothetical protein
MPNTTLRIATFNLENFDGPSPPNRWPFATDAKFPESDHAPVVGVFAVPAEWA